MKRTLTLPQGQAHIRFSAELEGVRLQFRFDWLVRGGYFHVTIERGGETLVAGRGLHPDIDILQGLRLGVGQVYLEGEAATPDNLGVRNRIVWETP